MSTPISQATLTADEIDDILYLARVNEAPELDQFLAELAQNHRLTQREVLEACVDADSGNSVLHYCGANGLTALLQSILPRLQSQSQSVSPLLNARNTSGNTPLHWAALNGHIETAKTLVDAGADLWLRNRAGNLAVFEAERAEKDDVVAYLLRTGGTEKESAEAQQQQGHGDGVSGEEQDGDVGGEVDANGDLVMSAGDVSAGGVQEVDMDLTESARQRMEGTGLGG